MWQLQITKGIKSNFCAWEARDVYKRQGKVENGTLILNNLMLDNIFIINSRYASPWL